MGVYENGVRCQNDQFLRETCDQPLDNFGHLIFRQTHMVSYSGMTIDYD